MTKRTTRQRSPGPQVDEVGHLDETLTEVTSTTAATLKKYRYHIVVAVAVVSLVVVGLAGVVAIQESNLTSENERLWNLLQSPAAQKAGVSLEALEELLADARESTVERYVVKSVGEYLLRRAVEDPDDATSTTNGVPKEQAYTRALALTNEAKTRFPDDADIQSWAGGVLSKLEGEHDTSWMPPSPRYTLPAPGVQSETKDS